MLHRLLTPPSPAGSTAVPVLHMTPPSPCEHTARAHCASSRTCSTDHRVSALLHLLCPLQVIPDSDAHRAGLQEGDQVLSVNDVDFQDIEHSKVSSAPHYALSSQAGRWEVVHTPSPSHQLSWGRCVTDALLFPILQNSLSIDQLFLLSGCGDPEDSP